MRTSQPSQFAECYGDIRLQVRIYLRQQFSRGVDIDEVTDAAMEKLFVQWQKVDDPLPWALTVARNLALDQLRWRPSVVVSIEPADDTDALPVSTLGVAEQQLKVDMILQAVHLLPANQRIAVILSAVGYQNPEIVWIMRSTPTCVAHYLCEGRKKLETILQHRRRKPKSPRRSVGPPGKG